MLQAFMLLELLTLPSVTVLIVKAPTQKGSSSKPSWGTTLASLSALLSLLFRVSPAKWAATLFLNANTSGMTLSTYLSGRGRLLSCRYAIAPTVRTYWQADTAYQWKAQVINLIGTPANTGWLNKMVTRLFPSGLTPCLHHLVILRYLVVEVFKSLPQTH